MHFILMIYDN